MQLHCTTSARYFDPKALGLDFESLMEDIGAAPDGSVIMLHGKCGVGVGWITKLNVHQWCMAHAHTLYRKHVTRAYIQTYKYIIRTNLISSCVVEKTVSRMHQSIV